MQTVVKAYISELPMKTHWSSVAFYFPSHRHANEVLKNETTMFEKYLKRVDPKDMGLQQAGECVQSFLSLHDLYIILFLHVKVVFNIVRRSSCYDV